MAKTKQYRIPLVWQMYGHIWIEAESEEKAIELALSPEYPLPDDGVYVDESVMLDDFVEIEVCEL